jgi:DNA-binding MarR family transcriptional regulator
MSDEARHVAFGVLSLKEYDAELTDAELAERQEFRGGARPASRFGVGGAAGTLRPMSRPSDPRLLVLHGLRLKGVTGADALADAVGLAAGEVTAQLRALEAEGLVAHRSGALNGWTLTPAGRAEQARLVGDEVDATGARDTVAGAYRRFRALNAGVLDACSRWQVRDVGGRPVRNDHRDRAYDAQVVDDLARLHRRAEPMLDDLARALDRYRPYGPRLRHAVDRVAAGDRDWFARPVMPSYHTVWFELHEDLLTTLGLDRSAEPVP